MALGQEANGNNLGKFFDLLNNNGMLCVLIRIALMRQFCVHAPYHFMIK